MNSVKLWLNANYRWFTGGRMRIFDRDEYAARVRRVQNEMSIRGYDLLLSCDPANMNYLTGYDGWSFYTPQLVAVPANGDEPICIVRGIDQPGGVHTCYLQEDNILGYPDDYVQALDKHPMEWMADVFKSRGLDKGQIAVDMDAYYYSARAHAALVTSMPNAEFVDAKNLVNWVRVIKSDAELVYMREAGTLIELAMRAGIDAIEPGVRQCDAVAEIYNAQIRGTADYGGSYTSIVPMLPTGEGTTTPHLTWDSSEFRVGEPTILELAGSRFLYHCPMSRTVHLGPAPTRMVEVADVAVEALNTAIDAMKPGVTCEEVQAAWNGVVRRHGIEKDSRMGYSIGLNYPPDWGEHTLSIRRGDTTILQPGMTIHVMPGIWLDNWGIEISEPVVVTEKGAEKFCAFPQDLVVKT